MDDNADDKSKEFFNNIKNSKKYKRFTTKEELLHGVKASLKECMISNSKNIVFDSTLIEESTYEDVDEGAIKLFYNSLKIKLLKSYLIIEIMNKF